MTINSPSIRQGFLTNNDETKKQWIFEKPKASLHLRLAFVGRNDLGVTQSPGADMGPKHKARVDLHTMPHRLLVGPNVAGNLALAGLERRVRRRTPLARIVGPDEATGLQLVICAVLGQRGQGL